MGVWERTKREGNSTRHTASASAHCSHSIIITRSFRVRTVSGSALLRAGVFSHGALNSSLRHQQPNSTWLGGHPPMRDCLLLERRSHACALQARRFLLRSRNSGSSLVPAYTLVPIVWLLGLVLVPCASLFVSPRACAHTHAPAPRLNASPHLLPGCMPRGRCIARRLTMDPLPADQVAPGTAPQQYQYLARRTHGSCQHYSVSVGSCPTPDRSGLVRLVPRKTGCRVSRGALPRSSTLPSRLIFMSLHGPLPFFPPAFRLPLGWDIPPLHAPTSAGPNQTMNPTDSLQHPIPDSCPVLVRTPSPSRWIGGIPSEKLFAPGQTRL